MPFVCSVLPPEIPLNSRKQMVGNLNRGVQPVSSSQSTVHQLRPRSSYRHKLRPTPRSIVFLPIAAVENPHSGSFILSTISDPGLPVRYIGPRLTLQPRLWFKYLHLAGVGQYKLIPSDAHKGKFVTKHLCLISANRRFPSCISPLFQSESKWEAFFGHTGFQKRKKRVTVPSYPV